jgi:hypothetical protein
VTSARRVDNENQVINDFIFLLASPTVALPEKRTEQITLQAAGRVDEWGGGGCLFCLEVFDIYSFKAKGKVVPMLN